MSQPQWNKRPDGLREIPGYCSWFPVGSACDPYSPAELESIVRSQRGYSASSIFSNIPENEREAYVQQGVDRANEIEKAMRASDPDDPSNKNGPMDHFENLVFYAGLAVAGAFAISLLRGIK